MNEEALIEIYTTGAKLKPILLTEEGQEPKWRWIVEEFKDDSFTIDGIICYPQVESTKIETLIK